MVNLLKTPSLYHLFKLFPHLGSFHFSKFSSKSDLSSVKSLLNAHENTSVIAARVCDILCTDLRWKNSSELVSLWPKLTPRVVEKVISFGRETGSVLQFFYWVSKNPSYKHDFRCYVVMLDRLVSEFRFEDADHVRVLIVRGCRGVEEIRKVLDYFRGGRIGLYSGNSLLIALGKFDLVEDAYNVYREMVCDGVRPNLLTLNTMINVLCKKGRVCEAEVFLGTVFKCCLWPDDFSHTSFILGHCRNRDLESAFEVFRKMLEEGCRPSSVTYSTLINGLCNEGRVDEALKMLRKMVESGIEPNVYTYTVPIVKLCEIGQVEIALRLGSTMRRRGCSPNVHTWTALISGSCRADFLEVGIGLYNRMVRDGVIPNTVTFNALIHELCERGRIEAALTIFDWMKAKGCPQDFRTYNEIMNGLCSSGSVQNAMVLFDDMIRAGPSPNVVTYNILIHGHMVQHKLDHAMKLFALMEESGCDPDIYTFAEMISGLCKGGKLELASSLFLKMTERGLRPNQFCFTSIIDGHCKVEDIDKALTLLYTMEDFGCFPTIETYNAIISALAKGNRYADAEKLCSELSERGLSPNVVTYTSLIAGLCQNGGTNLALKVFHEMEKNNCQPNLYTYTALVHGLCLEGKVDSAEDVFEEMQTKGIAPDVIAFNTLIDGFVMVGRLNHAVLLFRKMLELGCQPDFCTFSLLLKGLNKECQLLVDKVAVQNGVCYSSPSDDKDTGVEVISQLLVRLSEIGVEPTVSAYKTLVTGLCKEGKYNEAEQLVKYMQEKALSLDNDISMALLIIHCKNLRVEPALEILKSLSLHCELGPPLSSYGLLISTLFKIDRADEAISLFSDVLKKKLNTDEVLWSILVDSLLREGQLDPCVKLLHAFKSHGFTVSWHAYKFLASEVSKLDKSFLRDQLIDKLSNLRHISPG